MDEAQYDRRFTNRNRILDPHGIVWLSVPIEKEDKFSPAREVRINNSLPWREEHWKKLLVSYANATYFNLYNTDLKQFYETQWDLLFDLDLATTRKVLEWLGMKIPVILESGLGVNSSGTQRLVDICKAVGADTYVSGRGAKAYMDEKLFASNGIILEYQQYSPRPYHQRFGDSFVPDLSILDVLFNQGPGSFDLIRASNEEKLHAEASSTS